MSRVGKALIRTPQGVKITVTNDNFVTVEGKLGKLEAKFSKDFDIKIEGEVASVNPKNPDNFNRAMWGTIRSLLNNMVIGVSTGYAINVDIVGVGFRANLKGKYLNLSLGKSHNTKVEVPQGITVEVPKPTELVLKSIDKQAVGQFAAILVRQRKPEPYKGKGIKIRGRFFIKKEGKKS
jgi:large subunit ribosomal protein L6